MSKRNNTKYIYIYSYIYTRIIFYVRCTYHNITYVKNFNGMCIGTL